MSIHRSTIEGATRLDTQIHIRKNRSTGPAGLAPFDTYRNTRQRTAVHDDRGGHGLLAHVLAPLGGDALRPAFVQGGALCVYMCVFLFVLVVVSFMQWCQLAGSVRVLWKGRVFKGWRIVGKEVWRSVGGRNAPR